MRYTMKLGGSKQYVYSGQKTTLGTGGTNVRTDQFYLFDQTRDVASAKNASAHTHTISGTGSVTINSTGSGATHENRPPYYALAYIMKIQIGI